jgi:hypothetical protein
MPEINGLDLDTVVDHYIIAMLWSTHDESDESGGQPMDANYTSDDLAPGQYEEIERDVATFLERVGHLITPENYIGRNGEGHDVAALAGHDLWLTRVGHGAGFWDGDWESDNESGLDGPLTKAAKDLGEVWPYIGDDGQVYHS